MDLKISFSFRKKLILTNLVLILLFVITISFANQPIQTSVNSPKSTALIVDDHYNLMVSSNLGDKNAVPGGIAIDSNGGIILVGTDSYGNLTLKNAYDSNPLGISDAFITKFDVNGNLVFSTYFGGSAADDAGNGFGNNPVAVDSTGNIYITGSTDSLDFPIKSAAFSNLNSSYTDAFIAKFNSTGSLLFSTYLGGNYQDYGDSIAVDSSGNCYVTGLTYSTNFPTKNAWNQTNGGSGDAFVAKFNSTGALVFSTFIGGTGSDEGYGIAVGNNGNVFISGYTTSANFPLKNAYQSNFNNGGADGFISELNSTGSLIYSSYLGGSGYDRAYSITIDSSGNYFVAGDTQSTDFPTMNAFNTTYDGSGGYVGFVTEFNATNNLLHGTYIGGNTGESFAYSVAIDGNDDVYVTGSSYATNLPMINPFNATNGGGRDVFITKMDNNFNLVFSSLIGGTFDDDGLVTAVDYSQTIYITGRFTSPNFPLASSFSNTIYSGQSNVFYAKLTGYVIYPTTSSGVSSSSYSSSSFSTSGSSFSSSSSTSTNSNTYSPSSSATSTTNYTSINSNSSSTSSVFNPNNSTVSTTISKISPGFTTLTLMLSFTTIRLLAVFRKNKTR